MKDFLKKIKRAAVSAIARMRTAREAKRAFAYDRRQFMRYAGALHLDREAAALAEITMGYHVLEKGLTMPRRRLGFGKGAVRHLVNLVESFEARFGRRAQSDHAARVLCAYRKLHADSPDPMPRLDAFLAARPYLEPADEPHVKREDFFADKDAPFARFSASRHVCRHFAGPVPRELVEQAAAIAASAPSACNRQHARVYAIDDPVLRDRLFAVQKGTRGFGADADKVLVVTSDLSCVRWGWERHDCYTNGGMFAMALCYALHHLGAAHCILHWSVPPEADREAHRLLDIPESEAIVLLVACGAAPEEFDIAASPRLPVADILKWRGGQTAH